MSDQESFVSATRPLTPRQDRIEAAIERVLRARGTRSELRELVHQFADSRGIGGPALPGAGLSLACAIFQYHTKSLEGLFLPFRAIHQFP